MLDNIKPYLPSSMFQKRILIVLGVLVLGVATWKIIEYKPWEKFQKVAEEQKKASLSVANLTTQDQDSDGLADWEETFWGTDPTNPDTDGNGVPDGVQIGEQKKNDNLNLDSANLNETEKLSQEVAKTTLALGQAGAVTEDGANIISEKILNQIKAIPQGGTQYTLKDLKKRGSASATNIVAYTNEITAVADKVQLGNDTSLFIVGKAIQDKDPSLLKNLDPIIKMYDDATKNTLRVAVPNGFEDAHLSLLNAYARMRDDTIALKSVIDDPAKAMSILMNTTERYTIIEEAYKKMADQFRTLLPK